MPGTSELYFQMAAVNWSQAINYTFHHWPVLVLATIAGLLLHHLSYRLIQYFTPANTTDTIRFVVRKVRYPTMLAFILVALKMALTLIELSTGTNKIIHHLTTIVLIIAITWVLATAVKVFRWLTIRNYDLANKENPLAKKRLTQFVVLERIVIAIIVVVGIGAVLMTFDTVRSYGTSLLASAGIAGIIIGVAAQRSIATFLAGVQIAITQPIRLEDVVMIEGEFGVIEEINFTYVVVRTWDQRRLVVPITYFIENTFQNWTKVSPEILGAILLYTDYSVPVDAIREELDRLLEGNEKWDGRTKAVQVTDATEKSMLVRILISAVNPTIAWELRVWIRERMIAFIRDNYPESLPRSRVVLAQPEQDKQ